MDITVVNISKGPLEYNREAIKNFDINKLSFNVTPRLRFSVNSDYLGFQIDLIITQEHTQILKGGFLIGLAIIDWSKDLKAGLDLTVDRTKLIEISKTVWDVAIGIVAIQTSFENFNGILLPPINYEDFSKEILLMPS